MAELRHCLFECSYTDVQKWLEKTDIVVLPMGSTEKHGAHLPVGMDSYTIENIVVRACKKAEVPFTRLFPIGYSPHHMGPVGMGSGTMTFAGDTYRKILFDMAKSMIYHGFNKIVFASVHGSNTKVIEDPLRKLHYETGAFVCWYKPATERVMGQVAKIIEGPPEETPGWHSGEMETSQMLAADESLVHLELAKKDRAHAPKWMGPRFSKCDGSATVEFEGLDNIYVPMEHHEYADIAVIGNPFRGSKEKGIKLFEAQSDHLAAFLNEIKRWKIEGVKRDFPERA
ncbi:MAG: creatininase family protein [Firmicutes bacterium]|nr:creatininase family protein [Bacillota bacterium]